VLAGRDTDAIVEVTERVKSLPKLNTEGLLLTVN
jgi:hypothetical protein